MPLVWLLAVVLFIQMHCTDSYFCPCVGVCTNPSEYRMGRSWAVNGAAGAFPGKAMPAASQAAALDQCKEP